MKTKVLLIMGMLLFTLCSISAIYADTYVIGNSTFSLDDEYTLTQQGNQVVLYNDEYVITLYEGPIISPRKARENRINMGYTLIGERTYDFDGVTINQQNYNNSGIYSLVYTFKKNSQYYIITLNLYENQTIPEYEANPVTQIIDTLNTRK